MTDVEKLKELKEQIEPLIKSAEEIQDTIYKTELAKSRFKYWDYGYVQYWLKITSVGEEECSVIELCEYPNEPAIKINTGVESFAWVVTGTDITEEVFNKKREELINRLKL